MRRRVAAMNISSTWWIVLIGVGAIAVAIGNINYNRSRERERQQEASEKALGMLKVECNNNLGHVAQMRQGLANNQIPTENLETTAWSIVSTGGLLVQVDQDTLGRIADIYYLIGLADKYRSQVIDLGTGLQAALAGSAQIRQQYLTFLGNTLDRLEPKLREILARGAVAHK
jgi:hypothetical protein